MKLKIANRSRIKIVAVSILGVISVLFSVTVSAQYRPDLFFREDWKEIPAETPVSDQYDDTSVDWRIREFNLVDW